MSLNCPKCGAYLLSDVPYCLKCGKSFVDVPKEDIEWLKKKIKRDEKSGKLS